MNLPSEVTLIDIRGNNFQFNALENLVDFLKTEADFWMEQDRNVNTGRLSSAYFGIHNTFQNAFIQLENWRSNVPAGDESGLESELNSVSRNYFNQLGSYWIWSGNPFVHSWIDSFRYSPNTGDAFFEAITDRQLDLRPGFEALRGYILAYEFIQQDESLITKRRLAEKANFVVVRNQLARKKDELITEVVNFQSEMTDWKSATQTEIDEWQTSQQQHFDDTSLNHSNNFQERISTWTEKISDLESSYREKLRFDGPANYWKQSAIKFRKQGYYWTFLLVLVSAIFIIYLSNFFIAWISGQEITLKLQTLEGVVLFASIVSAFAILVRTFSKFAFSSFHLQRDAEEREQLTHLYLSLTNEKDVDAESRRIVLQALFSRSETGLLANEGGPTMPGVGEVINYIGRAGR